MPNNPNKVKFGLKNVHVAIQTKTGEGAYTYADPVAVPGAVNLTMNAEGSSDPFYADDIVYYRTTVNNGYTGDLELALVPEWFRTEILQETKDSNNVLVETNEATDPVRFALLFEFTGDQRAIRHVMYNCAVSERPVVSGETKTESTNPTTESLSLSCDPRDDGLIKARTSADTDATTYNGWYNAVYVPGVSGSGSSSGT